MASLTYVISIILLSQHLTVFNGFFPPAPLRDRTIVLYAFYQLGPEAPTGQDPAPLTDVGTQFPLVTV